MRLISGKLFMRCISVLLLFAYSITAFAQNSESRKYMSERRIFLWDVTISMVGATNESPNKVPATPRKNPDFDYKGWMYDKDRDIFDSTRENLCKMIDNIKGEDTEIIVVPYTNEIQPAFMVSSASAADKEKIKEMVRGWNNLKAAGTYTGTCLQKVMDLYFTSDKVNRVILLTDGRPSEGDGDTLFDIISKWDYNKKDTQFENNLLTYVMLTTEAYIEEWFDGDEDNEYDDGKEVIPPGVNPSEMVRFALANTRSQIYINEYASDVRLPEGGVIVVGCELTCGPGLDDVICSFASDETDLIKVSNVRLVPDENGNLEIPFYFSYPNRDDYRAALNSHGGVAKISLKCAVDPSCKNVRIEGNNTVDVEIIVRDEPRATISMSKM